MPDELTPGAAGQGGTEGAPADTGGQGFDFERSYRELHPAYTRATQELSGLRERLSDYEGLFEALHDSDPAVQAAAMDALGLEPADTGPQKPAEEFVDPLEEEVQELRAWRDQVQQERELEANRRQTEQTVAARDEYIGEAITFLEEQLRAEGQSNFKFSEREEEILGNLAIAMEDDEGIPDVDGAYARLYGPEDSFLELNRARWIETKTGAAQAPSGRTVSTKETLDTPAKRTAYVDRRWRELEDQQ